MMEFIQGAAKSVSAFLAPLLLPIAHFFGLTEIDLTAIEAGIMMVVNGALVYAVRNRG